MGWNDKDPVTKHKAHSCLAVGNTEPDPSKDETVQMDGKDVVFPQGKVGPNPLMAGKGHSAYSQSEYLVYQESQCRIRYVLKMKFDTTGGHWH